MCYFSSSGISSWDWTEPDQTGWVSDSLQTVLHLSEGKRPESFINSISYMQSSFFIVKFQQNYFYIIIQMIWYGIVLSCKQKKV